MVKQSWVKPQAMVEEFQPNEYVASCYTATIECVYPGDGNTNGDSYGGWKWDDSDTESGTNPLYGDYNGSSTGYWYESKSMPHGSCAERTTLSISDSSLSGYETTGRAIEHISGWSGGTGTFNCEWTSYYGATYHHKGRVTVTETDTSHPNRS